MAKEKVNKSILDESLIEFKDIQDMISENSTSQIRDLLSDAVKKELKNIITEAADDDEDSLATDNTKNKGLDDTDLDAGDNEKDIDNDVTIDGEPNVDVTIGDEDDNDGMDAEDAEGDNADGDDADNDEDFDINQFKTGDDEYDLTNSNIEDVVKVFKKIDDNDSIIVKKLDDGMIQIDDTNTDSEYLIDLNDEDEDDQEDEDNLDDEDINIDVDECTNEKNLDEDNTDIEVDLDGADDSVDEKNMTQSIGTNRRVGHMTQTRKAYAPGANNRDGAKLIANESKRIAVQYNSELKKIKEAYSKKLNSINEEIEEYKKTLTLFRNKLKENAVLNNNLAKYVKLITENATTKEEKVAILGRFSTEANTIETGNKLFESINNELNKKTSPSINIDKQFSTTAQKQQVNEQVIYQSDDLKQTINLMNRINNLR
jgi:hypothetical protein